MNRVKRDYYGLRLFLFLLALVVVLSITSYYLMQNFYTKSFLTFESDKKTVYFLESSTIKKIYERNKMDYNVYKGRISTFKALSKEFKYNSDIVYADELHSLEKKSILIVLDALALSEYEMNEIDNFVTEGGKIIFNYTSGFLSPTYEYNEHNLVKRVTNLNLNEEVGSFKPDKNAGVFSTVRLMSPLAKYLPQGKILSLVTYDEIPLFKTPKNLEADAYITNWSQDNYLKIRNNRRLHKDESGLIWNGFKGKGQWIYFSFPSYVFIDSGEETYRKLFKGMLEYLNEDIHLLPYPYIDAKNAIFISEDTEYKYESFQNFYKLAIKHQIPVTAFCVSNLAKIHPKMMKDAARSKYVEIASHSYTHKKIVGLTRDTYIKETIGSKISLEETTPQKIIGFRPPREEIDATMIQILQDGGFKYVLSKGESQLYPYFDNQILIIPRHGTDDYSYLINLDWNSKDILREMKHQTDVLSSLNAPYTLSVHTHLMSYGNNSKIIDKYMKYVNTQKHLSPMNGKMLNSRVRERKNMNLDVSATAKKVILTLTNDNYTEVKNVHYQIKVDPSISVTDVESEIIGVETELTMVNQTTYTLVVKSIMPQTKMILFLNYSKAE